MSVPWRRRPAALTLRTLGRCDSGLLVEKAGGKTSDGVTGGSILDTKITGIDQRTPLCIGSSVEVDRFNEMLGLVK